jgi:hypothetical protein
MVRSFSVFVDVVASLGGVIEFYLVLLVDLVCHIFFNSSVEFDTVPCKYVDLYYLLLTDLSEKSKYQNTAWIGVLST